ncbi:type II CRISPR RNA-guided endonuclease Cas9 [Algibacter sp. R77976]|uniref:type II CRISPR RNA-guided endonuclease Cas9 n=1 Tax=Algibacter sp. R77976 TaxID=3093873 RepID=UPI0037C6ABA2
MKKVLGLDLGTASIGWALVKEAENEEETSEIIKLGVRVNPLSVDEKTDFEKGRPLSINADRTLKRGARRNLHRFKLRRKNLIELLLKENFIDKQTLLAETGNSSTFETLAFRAKAVKEKIDLEAFARVLLAINKKRGYKSSRKAKNEEEGSLIDGMAVAKEMYDRKITPGQLVLELLEKGKKFIPDFYRSDLRAEFDAIWEYQKQFYPKVFTDEFYKALDGQGQQNTRKRFLAIHEIYTAENKGKRDAVKLQHYKWRVSALSKKLELPEVAYVLVEINNNLNNSSGYLGAISDRSKELFFNKETVGENLYNQIQKNPHTSLKNQVFYRQDYLNEFEEIWEKQAKFHPELTNKLKDEIRDIVIFYQRKLKSQKHLISICEFEKQHKVLPKSSPLFQEFKIWQVLNNVQFKNKETKAIKILNEDDKTLLFEELNLRGNLKTDEVLKLMELPKKLWTLNYKEGLEGNSTNKALYNVYQNIAENEGYGFDWAKKTAKEIKDELKNIFPIIGIKAEVLDFESAIDGNNFDKQLSYQLWHLLYATEDDVKLKEEDVLLFGNSNTSLKKNLFNKYGFKKEYGDMLAGVSFPQDYGSLSAKAVKKILPFLKEGHEFSEACKLAGYRHSHHLTKEEAKTRILKDTLELLPKNSLRNPVVEKILNQMINVINQVIETYGKPDEVRIELARELKKSAKERAETTTYVNAGKKLHEDIRKILAKDFGIKNASRNDIIRYKLYEELSTNGYKSLYTNKFIRKEQLFSSQIEIEHIIPKAKLFDDSFSNKTLAFSTPNKDKGDSTAFDFIENNYASDLENYQARVKALYDAKAIGRAKYNKLLMKESELPDGFIERDLRNSQYIAKKAKQLLLEVFRTVNTTTGSITDKLREDWDLINVMKELNLPKYKALGLTEIQERKNGKKIEQIIDWTKRNDHRHHAMDALTVAFTTYNHVNYLNHLNASRNEKNNELFAVRNKITKMYGRDEGRKKRKFVPPMPYFREEAKEHIESILVSFKAKNKVVTKNKNIIKTKNGYKTVVQLTPRGQLHKETVYAGRKKAVVKTEKISAKFTLDKINQVTKPLYRAALLKRLEEHNGDPKKAFSGKNSVTKNPVLLENGKMIPIEVKTQYFETIFTIRKPINPDNFKDLKSLQKIQDLKVKEILENRLKAFGGKAKEAFSDLDKNPIWLNKEKGLQIKRVAISGVSNVETLHHKKDHLGKDFLNEKGEQVPADFVSTGNNHHVAIYKDSNGKLQEKVVPFYEAVANVNADVSIIDKEYNKEKGWEFLFTMKQNEMFVFPSDDFSINEIDLLDKANYTLISPHLFRVQKIATKNYMFCHHLETKVVTNEILKTKKKLSQITYNFIQSTEPLRNLVKIRLNHLGEIVHVGEY